MSRVSIVEQSWIVGKPQASSVTDNLRESTSQSCLAFIRRLVRHFARHFSDRFRFIGERRQISVWIDRACRS